MGHAESWTRAFAVTVAMATCAVLQAAPQGEKTLVVPTHPRILFRKDDLAGLRRKCLTTHAREYAILKASADRAIFLDAEPIAPGLLYQLTGESRYLQYAASDYDAFHEALEPAVARKLANDILFKHRRLMAPDGTHWLGSTVNRYMPSFDNRSDMLRIFGDDVSLARPGELAGRLESLAGFLSEARQVYNAVAYRRGGKNTSFHCACFFERGPRFFEKWRVATGQNCFADSFLVGSILQPLHNTYPLEHQCASMTNSWGHDHLGRPADYILASRARDGLCQWVLHNPGWVSARDVGDPEPGDLGALGRAWVAAIKGLGGYKEHSPPVGYWPGDMWRRILYYDPQVAEVAPESLPTSALFEGLGIACMRSSWRDDAVFARLHSGPNFRGEPPHLNDNTFLVYHKGRLVTAESSSGVLTSDANSILVKDPDETIMVTGTCGGLWPESLWQGKAADLKASQINDGGQSYWTEDIGKMNIRARGRIAAYEQSELYTYAVGDATQSYNPAKLKRFTRQFLYIKPGLILICDRMDSTRPELEKRWVLHTRGKPRAIEGGNAFVVDAIDAVQPKGTRGWERTVGFDVPQTEEGEHTKTTLRFRTQWDGVEVGLVHATGPKFGKVAWALDDGEQHGQIDQHREVEDPVVETVLARNIPKGQHVIELNWQDGRVNYAFFSVKLGGRLFVTTLLPAQRRREVRPNKSASENPYARNSDWRTDIVAVEPKTGDVFLHVIEATDRSQDSPIPITQTAMGSQILLKFEYQGSSYEITFDRTGDVGGSIRICDPFGRELASRRLPDNIVDSDDDHIAKCRAEIARHPFYEYQVREIVGLTPVASSQQLVEALVDDRWYVRFYAVRALAAKGDKGVTDELVALLGDSDPRVAGIAAEALGRLGAKTAEVQLIRSLGSPADEVRYYAAWALGRLKSAKATAPLAELLSDDNDFVSTSAAEALGQIRDPASAVVLSNAIAKTDRAHLKMSYLWALLAIGGDLAEKQLVQARHSEDSAMRACALASLAARPSAASTKLLAEACSDSDEAIRLFALRKLAGIGDASASKQLLDIAEDRQAQFPARVNALELVARSGNNAVADQLVDLLDDQKAYPWPNNRDSISAHAGLALHCIGDAKGTEFLRSALMEGGRGQKYNVARGAATALGRADKEMAVPILIEGLSVEQTRVKQFIVESLYQLTGEDPAGDLEVVGWRRADQDARRWLKWWDEHKAEFTDPEP